MEEMKPAQYIKDRWPAYVWFPFIVAFISIPAGFYYVNWSQEGIGAGLYSHQWAPDDVFAYWSPNDFYQSVDTVKGKFTGQQCVQCHEALTPGIVNDWRNSLHFLYAEGSKPDSGKAIVYCTECHGNDHEELHLPTPDICANCHKQQHDQFMDEKRFGFPSHALAMERALDASHFVDKPKAEVTSCVQCHSVATKCDSCHSRHEFSAAEARRPEACITCHSGPPHPDDESYFASAHGKIYLQEGDDWDWSKPLTKGNYKAPTCAYCHMDNGQHQVANKSIWKFGIKQINPQTSGNEIKRDQWVERCSECHESDWSRQQLKALDLERKKAWDKLNKAERLLRMLRSDNLLFPPAGKRPSYPNSTMDRFFPRERIGFFDGQASAFYNVSAIERNYFEMWYFDNLSAYKGAAHGDFSRVKKSHQALDEDLIQLNHQAEKIRRLSTQEKNAGIHPEADAFWNSGDYTDYNRENN
jgi:hydroxylamine dehydrogenase